MPPSVQEPVQPPVIQPGRPPVDTDPLLLGPPLFTRQNRPLDAPKFTPSSRPATVAPPSALWSMDPAVRPTLNIPEVPAADSPQSAPTHQPGKPRFGPSEPAPGGLPSGLTGPSAHPAEGAVPSAGHASGLPVPSGAPAAHPGVPAPAEPSGLSGPPAPAERPDPFVSRPPAAPSGAAGPAARPDPFVPRPPNAPAQPPMTQNQGPFLPRPEPGAIRPEQPVTPQNQGPFLARPESPADGPFLARPAATPPGPGFSVPPAGLGADSGAADLPSGLQSAPARSAGPPAWPPVGPGVDEDAPSGLPQRDPEAD